jgi:hypothetical protein
MEAITELKKLEKINNKIMMLMSDHVDQSELFMETIAQLRYAYVIAASSRIEQAFYQLLPRVLSNNRKTKCVESFAEVNLRLKLFTYFDFKAPSNKAANKFYSALGVKETINDIKSGTTIKFPDFCSLEASFIELMVTKNKIAHEYKVSEFDSNTFKDYQDKYNNSKKYVIYIAMIIKQLVKGGDLTF